jgi:hypothetical protein
VGGIKVSTSYGLCNNSASTLGGITWTKDGNADANAAPWITLPSVSDINAWDCIDLDISVSVPDDVSAGTYDSNFTVHYGDNNSYSASLTVTALALEFTVDTNWETGWDLFDANMIGQYREYEVDLDTSENINADGNISADYFIGEGSLLTGINLDQNEMGRFVGVTSASFTGKISGVSGKIGYAAADENCAGNYSGSHFCSTVEVVLTIADGNFERFTGVTGWVSQGAPGYTANSNDCNGFYNSTSRYLGAYWKFISTGGQGTLTSCTAPTPLACCK